MEYYSATKRNKETIHATTYMTHVSIMPIHLLSLQSQSPRSEPQVHVLSCSVLSTDYSPPGSSVTGNFQARILEHFTISILGDLPDPGTEPTSLCLLHWQVDSSALCHLGSHWNTQFLLNFNHSLRHNLKSPFFKMG